MLVFFVYVVLCAVLVPVFRVRGVYGYTDAKNQLFLLLTILTICAGLFAGGVPAVAGAPALLLFSFITLLTVSVLWTDGKENAIQDLPRWWALFAFFVVCGHVPENIVLPAVFITSVFAALYGIVQQLGPYKKLWFVIDPLWPMLDNIISRRIKADRFYSWLGNSNYTGAYLVPCFFIGLYLVSAESLWYLIGLVPVWIGIGMTRCRAAWAATIIGLSVVNAMINPWTLLFIVPAAVVAAIIAMQRIESTMGRWYYLQICWRLFKRAPVFGHGPRVFRRQIFNIQAEMNEEDPTYLGTPDKPGRNTFPVGKRAHNDHAETLIETGIVGYGLLAAFFVTAIMASDNIFITGGIIAGIVNAFFFYNLRTGATALPLFALAGLSAGSHGLIPVSWPVAAGISALLLYLAYRLAWIPFKCNLLHHDGKDAKGKDPADAKNNAKKLLYEALYYDPNNSAYLDAAAQLHMPEDPPNALLSYLRGVHHNDGQELLWNSWFKIGYLAVANGAVYLARSCFAKAIQLNPSFKPAHDNIKQCQQIIDQIEAQKQKQQGRIIIPNGKSGQMVQAVH